MKAETEAPLAGAPGSANVEWVIVLVGDHHDIFVTVTAPENATDSELLSLAEQAAMAKTYIWEKRQVRPNATGSPTGADNQGGQNEN